MKISVPSALPLLVASVFCASCVVTRAKHDTPQKVTAGCTVDWREFDEKLSVSTVDYAMPGQWGLTFKLSAIVDDGAAIYTMTMKRTGSGWYWLYQWPTLTTPGGKDIQTVKVWTDVGYGGLVTEVAIVPGLYREKMEEYSQEPFTFQIDMHADAGTVVLGSHVFRGFLDAVDAACAAHGIDPVTGEASE